MRNFRLFIVLVFFFIFGAAILSRLVFLQIFNHKLYKALGEGQQKILTSLKGERGQIFFKNGEPLAVNRSGKFVFVYPEEIEEKEKTAEILSEILDIDKEWIFEKTKKNSLFESIKHKLSKEEQDKLLEKDLTGVYLQEETLRYYPQENTASHIVGFLGGDDTGQYGVEGFYNEILSGKEVLSEKEKGPFGYSIFSDTKENSNGANIFLTIDPSIQFVAENLLLKYKEQLNFDDGQILVLDPSTGKILAMAAIPNFDPNNYSEVQDIEIFQNPITQKIFEPGSVFKPFTMTAAINEERVSPQTKYIDKGIIKIGSWTIYNYDQRVWGEQTMTGVLEKSINTGAVFAELELGHNLFLKYLEKFGFFEKTGIDLQGEVFSQNLEFKNGYEINFATASFGQGIEITPIQLARAFSAIANKGKLKKPYILDRILTDEKETKTDSDFEEEIFSQKTASEITTMLVSVVENGFSKAAKIDGYFIAGKTGTAQIPWPSLEINKSGYSDKTWQTFIGFAPAFNPEFLIIVKLTDPAARTAEYSALPIFKELAKYIINYLEIPPDYE